LFQQWKQNNGKDYADDSAADRAAFAAWSDNLDAVVEHNKKSGVKFFKGLSAYSDLTFAEFKDKWLMPDRPVSDIPVVPSAKTFSPGGSRKLKQTPPLEFDWRARGVVPPARDQGGCGACW
jgi:C1A family cysteine protease